MTTTLDREGVSVDDVTVAQALFEEAHRLRRRRWIVGVVIVAMMLGAGLDVGLTTGGGGAGFGKAEPIHNSWPSVLNAPSAIAATLAAKSALVRFGSHQGGAWSGKGYEDFFNHSASYTANGWKYLAIGNHLYVNVNGVRWFEAKRQAWVSNASAQAILSLPNPFGFLDALSNPAVRTETMKVGGVLTSEYASTLTLRAFQAAAVRGSRVAPLPEAQRGVPLVPPAAQIVISVRIWIDALGRIIQIEMQEPRYSATYQGGSRNGGPQVPDESLASYPHGRTAELPLISLTEQGSDSFTLDLSGFGSSESTPQPPKKTQPFN